MDSGTGGRSADSIDDVIKNLYINYIIVMASGTGNSFIHHGLSNNASLLSAAYPHGMPSGMNLPISQLESVGMTQSAAPYTFAYMGHSGGRRRLNKSKSKNLRKQKRRLTRSHSTSLKRRHTRRSRRYK